MAVTRIRPRQIDPTGSTAGQIMTSNGPASDPSWQNAGAGSNQMPNFAAASLPAYGSGDIGRIICITDCENYARTPLVGANLFMWNGEAFFPLNLPQAFPGLDNFFISDFAGNNDAGLHPYISGVTGTGAAISLVHDTARPHLGALQLSTGTTATGLCRMTTSELANLLNFDSSGKFAFSGRIRIPTLSDATNRFVIRLGFTDVNTGAVPTDGAYIEYDEVSSANWRTNARNNAAGAAVSSSSAVAAATWYRFKITCTFESSVLTLRFFINDTLIATRTTDIPTGTARAMGMGISILKSVGTTARTMQVDWLAFHHRLAASQIDS